MAKPFTPEQISQILEEFFKVVGTRQYIGARYVPIFGRKGEESIEWDNSAPYEPLTIVLYQGNSYTSRQYVPVGVEITNQEFWAITGNYNAQIEQYRSEVATFDDRITTNENRITTNETAITTETTRAKEAEQANADAIAIEVTRAKEAEQANADAIAIEVTRAKEAEQANADAIAINADAIAINADTIKNLGFANPLYGVCRIPKSTIWKYVCTYDFSSIGTMGNMPSRGSSYDYSDASNLFELNGILYYPQQNHNDIYATRDGETWESGYGLNFPRPLGTDYLQYAPMLFKDRDNNIKLAMARQYNSEKITNVLGNDTVNFRIDVFDCTVDSSGKINISNEYVTVLSKGTHIDPYIVYTEAYGYIMACKDENTCQIELYNGNSLTNLNLVGKLPYIGCEAPKFYTDGNYISLITQAYYLHTGSPETAAGSHVGNNYWNFYFSTHISLNPFSYDGMRAISCPSSYRHIAFIMNSEVLAKYARKHGIVPYASSIENKIIKLVINNETDIYPAALPMKTAFCVLGDKRTITIHKATVGIQSPYITYIIVFTNHEPTITTEDGAYTHVLKDGEVVPIYIHDDGRIWFS